VVAAGQGREAINLLDARDFDLVLMDVQMPEMDGFEATAVIRAKERRTGRHTPIIAMTAHAMKGDRERCLEAGMDAYVSKPIRATELFDTIARVVGPSGQDDVQCEPTPSEESGLDWSRALSAVNDDQTLLRTLAETLVDESAGMMAAIREAIARGDATALQLAAHTLQGSIRYFGSTVAFEHACRLEAQGENDDLKDAEEALPALERGMATLTAALAASLRRGDAASEP
jgi:CheY-like chemotaxis protein